MSGLKRANVQFLLHIFVYIIEIIIKKYIFAFIFIKHFIRRNIKIASLLSGKCVAIVQRQIQDPQKHPVCFQL